MKDPTAPISERDWQKRVTKWAKDLGWTVQTTYFSPYSSRGILDLSMCRPPRFILAELKTDRGKLRPEQREWIDLVGKCGIEVFVWKPSDEKQVLEILK